jgi:hypothetical protein
MPDELGGYDCVFVGTEMPLKLCEMGTTYTVLALRMYMSQRKHDLAGKGD